MSLEQEEDAEKAASLKAWVFLIRIFIAPIQGSVHFLIDLRKTYAYACFMSITPKQKQILDFMTEFTARQGYAPSQVEIAKHFGFKSLGTVQNYLIRLERQGLLHKSWNARRGTKVLSSTTTLQSKHPHEADAAMTKKAVPAPSQLMPSNVFALPLVGRVAAGLPIEAIESQENIEVPSTMIKGNENFVLRVNGDSMIEDGILDGDFVVIKKQTQAENGQTVVALIDNEATIKTYYRRGSQIELRPANSKYKPILVELGSDEAKSFRIEGVLVGVMRLLRS